MIERCFEFLLGGVCAAAGMTLFLTILVAVLAQFGVAEVNLWFATDLGEME